MNNMRSFFMPIWLLSFSFVMSQEGANRVEDVRMLRHIYGEAGYESMAQKMFILPKEGEGIVVAVLINYGEDTDIGSLTFIADDEVGISRLYYKEYKEPKKSYYKVVFGRFIGDRVVSVEMNVKEPLMREIYQLSGKVTFKASIGMQDQPQLNPLQYSICIPSINSSSYFYPRIVKKGTSLEKLSNFLGKIESEGRKKLHASSGMDKEKNVPKLNKKSPKNPPDKKQ